MGTKYTSTVEPSPFDPRDEEAEEIIPALKTVKSVDLRPMLMPIRDQGDQGSCAAHAAASMKEWQERIDLGLEEYMSRQFVYDNRKNQKSEGMYPRDVMKILQKIGCCRESFYPYGEPQPKKKIGKTAYADAKHFRIKRYARINTIEGLKRALSKNGPCLFAVPVWNYTDKIWRKLKGNSHQGGHAMTAVGYTKRGFLIRNSWGKYWGFDGYTIFPYEDWGMHYEAWTTIDDKSSVPEDLKKKVNGWMRDVKKGIGRLRS